MLKLLVLCLLAALVTRAEHQNAPSTQKPDSISHPSEKPNSTKTGSSSHPSEKPNSTKTSSSSHPSEKPNSKDTLTCCTGKDCKKDNCTAETSKPFCVTTAEENTFYGTKSFAVNQTCGTVDNIDFCNVNITITLNDKVYWRSSTKCCNKDTCNSESSEAPAANTTQSKLVCPSCFVFDAFQCKQTQSMKCAASETKCINVSGKVQKGGVTKAFAGQGCATPSASSIKNDSTVIFGDVFYHISSYILKDATDGASQTPGSVPFTFLLSSFVGLMHAKFIY